MVEQAFVPLSVEMVASEVVPLTMVTARDQMIVVGLEEAPYRLVTAVSRFVWPRGWEERVVRVVVMLVRMFDRSANHSQPNRLLHDVLSVHACLLASFNIPGPR